MGESRSDIVFHPGRFLAYLKRKLLWILAFGIICAVCAWLLETIAVRPVYRSATKLYVQAQQDGYGIENTDMQANTMLTRDYAELIRSRDVTEEVIRQLGLDLTHEELIGQMDITIPAETRIIEVGVSDTDPERARQIVETVSETAAEHISSVTRTEELVTAEHPNLPEQPVRPCKTRDTAAAGMIGSVAAVMACLLLFLRDDRIYTDEEVENIVGICVLGVVPAVKKEKVKRRRRAWHQSNGKRDRQNTI